MPSYLVVGASRGLGYAWLRYLCKNPANTVIGLARVPAPVEESLMKEGITNVQILPGDMTSHASLAKAADLAAPLLPFGLDVLIVNGAYVDYELFFLSPSDYSSASQAQLLHDNMHASLDTNVLGVVYSINAFLPLVLKGAVKKVVVISSGLADPDLAAPSDDYEGIALHVGYSALKGAMNIIVAKFAAELKSKGVIVLALCPGVVNTSQTAPKEDEITQSQGLHATFTKKYPNWKGPVPPIESVESQFKVIEGLKIEDSGKFLSHKGDKNWL